MVLTETPPHLFCSPDLVIQLVAFSLQLLLFLRCLDAAAKAPFVAEETGDFKAGIVQKKDLSILGNMFDYV